MRVGESVGAYADQMRFTLLQLVYFALKNGVDSCSSQMALFNLLFCGAKGYSCLYHGPVMPSFLPSASAPGVSLTVSPNVNGGLL